MNKFSILSVACIAAAQSGLACGNTDNNAPMAGAGGNTSGTGAAGTTSSTGATTGGAGALSDMAAGLSDADMLSVLEATSAAQVRQGHIAESKAQNTAVRSFATKMIRDYTLVDYSAAATASSMALSPSTNQVASMVTHASDAVVQGMDTMPSGAEFDRNYMDVQIQAHNGTRAVVEQMLVNADTTPVRMLLTRTLEGVQADFDQAVFIRYTLK